MSIPAWYFSGRPDAEGRFTVANRGDSYTVPCTLTETGPVVLCRRGLQGTQPTIADVPCDGPPRLDYYDLSEGESVSLLVVRSRPTAPPAPVVVRRGGR